MTIDAELEKHLTSAAERESLPVNEVAPQFLKQTVPVDDRAKRAIDFIQSLIDDQTPSGPLDTDESDLLAIDDDRTSDRMGVVTQPWGTR